jgi:hypothetical protein
MPDSLRTRVEALAAEWERRADRLRDQVGQPARAILHDLIEHAGALRQILAAEPDDALDNSGPVVARYDAESDSIRIGPRLAAPPSVQHAEACPVCGSSQVTKNGDHMLCLPCGNEWSPPLAAKDGREP